MTYVVREIMAQKKHKRTGKKRRYIVMECRAGDVQQAVSGILHSIPEDAAAEIFKLEGREPDPFAGF